MKQIIILSILVFLSLTSYTQKTLSGKIYGINPESKEIKDPLIGANIYWLGTANGTSSGSDGFFSIEIPSGKTPRLIASYIGYKTDTFNVTGVSDNFDIILEASQHLDEVVISKQGRSEFISKIQPLQTQTITQKGLQKLPCCNLSESFENTATIDVGFTDAVSGAKQIKMLGLAGKYSQIMIEKRPNLRGLSSSFGLMYIPGSWMESIQISKGTSSVVDGFESITGQINVEYKKPENSIPLHVNLYSNIEGRLEANVLAAHKLNEKWSTMLLFSGGHMGTSHDKNNDSFLDVPLTDQLHVLNRWKYINGNYRFQVGIDILDENRKGGQVKNTVSESVSNFGLYKIGIDTRKYEAYFKGGIGLEKDHLQSIGFIGSGVYHEMNSSFGFRNYNAVQKSLYFNFISSTQLWNENNILTSGISIVHDDFDEVLQDINI